jgi:hypothetical protein
VLAVFWRLLVFLVDLFKEDYVMVWDHIVTVLDANEPFLNSQVF